MKYLMIIALCFSFGCNSLYKPKQTTFYNREGKPVKTFVGRGMYDGDSVRGDYKIWTTENWIYYEYHCTDCTYAEKVIRK